MAENLIKSMKIPDGFELNDDDEYKVKGGEAFYDSTGFRCGFALGYTGMTVKEMREKGYYIFKTKSLPKTPEEKKKKAREFVRKHIASPTKKDYLKFEEVFLRDDNFGL